MKEIGIYKITNPKGKIYIGQTTNIKKRFNSYKKLYLNANQQPKIYRSLKKYGSKNHIFEIIEKCTLEQLNEREIFWGLKFNVLNSKTGLNLKLGNGRGFCSEETKQKMSKSHLGKIISKEHKEKLKNTYKNMSKEKKEERSNKISKATKGISKKSPMSGKKHKEYTKQKMSKSHLGKKRTEETKQKMKTSALGKKKTEQHKKSLSESTSNSFGRPILQKDLYDNLIKEWKTGKLASQELNLNYLAINSCCRRNENNNRKRNKNNVGKYTSSNYIWEYKINTLNKKQII
jgi:group I intron endonuclease